MVTSQRTRAGHQGGVETKPLTEARAHLGAFRVQAVWITCVPLLNRYASPRTPGIFLSHSVSAQPLPICVK